MLIALNLAYNKNTLYKTLDYWSTDMLNFDFLEKDLGIVSSPHFVYDFSRKMLLMLYSINWPNLIVWLPLLLEILGNMYIVIVCFPGFDVFQILKLTLSFYSSRFLHDRKVIRTKRDFKVKLKKYFSSFS